jgi:hypothetical protein
MPLLQDPKQFPHMIFWTPDGLIKKLLIRQATPKTGFWVSQSQIHLLSDNSMLDMWSGELEDEDEEAAFNAKDSDDDEENEEEEEEDEEREDGDEDDEDGNKKKKNRKKMKKKKADPWTLGDRPEHSGVSLSVVATNAGGEQFEAVEYSPGGTLAVCLEVS